MLSLYSMIYDIVYASVFQPGFRGATQGFRGTVGAQ